MNRKRTQWIDALKGYGILLVVFGHCITYLENSGYAYELIWKYIASFNMPLFFMISGYLYRSGGQDIKTVFFKKLKTLGIPFLVATVLFIPLGYFRAKITGNGYSIADDIKYVLSLSAFGHTLNGVTWFLVALFWIYMIHYMLTEKCRLSAIQCALAGMVMFVAALNMPGLKYMPLGRWKVILTQYLIFALGYVIKQYALECKCRKVFWLNIIAGLTLAMVLNDTVAVSGAGYNHAAVFLLAAVFSCMGYLSLFKELFDAEKASGRIGRSLAVLGRYSLLVMCTHIPVMYVARVMLSSRENPVAVFVLIMIAEMFLIALLVQVEKRKDSKNGSEV